MIPYGVWIPIEGRNNEPPTKGPRPRTMLPPKEKSIIGKEVSRPVYADFSPLQERMKAQREKFEPTTESYREFLKRIKKDA